MRTQVVLKAFLPLFNGWALGYTRTPFLHKCTCTCIHVCSIRMCNRCPVHQSAAMRYMRMASLHGAIIHREMVIKAHRSKLTRAGAHCSVCHCTCAASVTVVIWCVCVCVCVSLFYHSNRDIISTLKQRHMYVQLHYRLFLAFDV